MEKAEDIKLLSIIWPLIISFLLLSTDLSNFSVIRTSNTKFALNQLFVNAFKTVLNFEVLYSFVLLCTSTPLSEVNIVLFTLLHLCDSFSYQILFRLKIGGKSIRYNALLTFKPVVFNFFSFVTLHKKLNRVGPLIVSAYHFHMRHFPSINFTKVSIKWLFLVQRGRII